MNSDANQPVLGMFLNGRYKIVQNLGIGILGQTYVAEDSWQNGTPQCIVKCFIPQNHYSSQQWEICQHRFTSDADALRQLGTHDQIPKFLDSFEDEHGFYLVRELIVGEPLIVVLPMSPEDNNRWSEQECIALLDEVLSILELIHRQGIIHGDIKPSNLIRRTCDGKLVLMDFGVAHPIHRTLVTPQIVPIHPALASVATTPVEYSPANELGSQPCFGNDLYALGAIAIQALTGLDFLQLSLHSSTHQIDWRQQAAVSETLAGVLNSMIQTDFESRYQSAADIRTALRSLGMIEEEQELRTEELSEPSNSNSSLDLSDGKDLALCFHDVTQLPLSHVSQSSEVRENQGIQITTPQSQEGSTNETWEYARELAIACLPKLPPVMTGIGAGLATSNALAISFGLYSLLNTAPSNPGLDLLAKATEHYQAGNLDEAIALTKSIPTNSSVYQESVATVNEWRSEWEKAVAQFKAVEQAFQDERWRDVLKEADNAPDIAYWQNKIGALVEQAKPELEKEAQHLLKQAYQQAADKDFTGAIALIKQIPPETPTGSKIQPKLKEYTQKQQIKAEYLLQKAYQHASDRDFKIALKYLSQIPEQTPTYEIAQAKMTEYSRKQDFQEEVERQVQLAANFTAKDIKLSELPQALKSSKKSTKVSSNLNPGNQFTEVAPKPALIKTVRR